LSLSGDESFFFLKGETEDEYLTSCLLMVFVAVSIPKLARSDSSMYQAQLEVRIFLMCLLLSPLLLD
jgi:hypothetical protein